MRPKLNTWIRLLCALTPYATNAQLPGIDFDDLARHGADPETVVYKTTPEGDLTVDIYRPEVAALSHAALIFVHGGGWTAGTSRNHREHSRYFAARGLVVFNLSYRLIPISGEGIDLFDQVGDIRSAVRWVRAHAETYGIDPHRIALTGESAGGHLAACVAFIDAFDAAGEDTTVSAKPDLAILLNPITDLPRIPWYSGHAAQVGDAPLPIEDTPIEDPLDASIHPARRLSPLFYAQHTEQPPALFVHGEADTVVPFAQSESMHNALLAAGHESHLIGLPRMDHAFVIPGWGPPEAINRTLRAMDAFLADHGFLRGEPTLLPLDINLLANGSFDDNLEGWNASGAVHLEAPGATPESTGYLRGDNIALVDLSQTLSPATWGLPAEALDTQMLTVRLSAWLRVSELSHYEHFELALHLRRADGTPIADQALHWESLAPDTWTNAQMEILLPADTDQISVTVRSATAMPVELDELSLTLSTTSRATTYAQWQSAYFSPDEIAAGATARSDTVLPDGANLRNIEKYALRLPRTVTERPRAGVLTRDQHLALQFPFDAKKTDLTYRVGFDSDLDFAHATILSGTSENSFASDARGLATVVDPDLATTRFAHVVIEPR